MLDSTLILGTSSLVLVLVLCASMLEFVCAFCVGICLHLLCFDVLKLIEMGNTPSILKESALWHILDKRAKHRYEPMTKKDMIYYCNRVWIQYMLGSEKQWPLNGSLNYFMISQL